MMEHGVSEASPNKLLNAMPPEDAAAIIAHATAFDMSLRQTLYAPDVPITHCYFVEAGMVSIVAVLDDGDPMEMGVIGFDGFVGLPVILGAGQSPGEAMVQLPGRALQIDATVLKQLFDERVGVRRVLLRFAQAMQVQVAQTAACNGRHDTEQRLARWLLMVVDKFRTQPIPLTQEFLSMMLGVRRQQVSLTAAVLQNAGLIKYKHGSIRIVNREGLEAVACECYGVVARESTRLLE
jgi:CRP-like cAMP-binding protein